MAALLRGIAEKLSRKLTRRFAQPEIQAHNEDMLAQEDSAMSIQTDNTKNTAEELRQAAKRLGDGAAYVAREVPWIAIAKGTGTLAINILRYSMGIAIYGLIIWPYRLLVAPTCAVAAGMAATQSEEGGDADWLGDQDAGKDHSLFPPRVDNRTGDYTFDTSDSSKRPRFF
jgi:hypothetical protein